MCVCVCMPECGEVNHGLDLPALMVNERYKREFCVEWNGNGTSEKMAYTYHRLHVILKVKITFRTEARLECR